MAKNYSKKNKNNKMDMNYLLRNRNVLYVVLLFAIANLFSYLMMKQLDAVAFFIIIGFLTSYFSKNMIVIMFTSMISTFLLVQVNLVCLVLHVSLRILIVVGVVLKSISLSLN